MLTALLRAMADKLVPGIPHSTRIAILQQTDADSREGKGSFDAGNQKQDETEKKSVLDYVMSSDHHRNYVIARMDCKDTGHSSEEPFLTAVLLVLSKTFETEDPLQPVKGIRKIRHDDIEKQLFLAQKNASLKSGARGLQARKELKSVETKLQTSKEL